MTESPYTPNDPFPSMTAALRLVMPTQAASGAAAGYLNALSNGVGTVGDQTATISAFFDQCHAEGRNAYFPRGVYESGQIIKGYALNILGEPGAEIKVKSGTSGELWTFAKITIAAPATTATGVIDISLEGPPVAVSVTARTAGTGFEVEAASSSTARINWAVYE